MQRLFLHISNRWLALFSLTFFLSASGLINTAKGDHLFLRSNSGSVVSERPARNASQSDAGGSVKGAASQSAKAGYISSQVQVVSIGTTKYEPPPKPTVGSTSKQIDEHTWTITVDNDARNATANEILSALNAYRQKNGRGALAWDGKLGNFAQGRASGFSSSGKLDSHAGFTDYINNHDGFHALGFQSLGENSSYGYTLGGTNLIELVYAGDKPHNDNQLSSNWSYVGIGVSGTATDLVFGGNKL